jgi:Escherichia/Staphylococcus phage prohead protease
MTAMDTTRSVAAAAAERQQNVAQRVDRPSQRRNAPEAGSGRGVRVRSDDLALRAKSGESKLLEFVGHASVVERGYEMFDWYGPYTEIVSAGAFDATLARGDLDVPLVLGHDQMRRLARTTNGTLKLSMDETGLLVEADQLDPDDYDVAYIAPKLRSGLIDEMSFAFRIDSGQWSPDYSEYRIDKVEIHRGDVAIVGYGASPHTDSGLRSTPKPTQDKRQHALALLELALAGE